MSHVIILVPEGAHTDQVVGNLIAALRTAGAKNIRETSIEVETPEAYVDMERALPKRDVVEDIGRAGDAARLILGNALDLLNRLHTPANSHFLASSLNDLDKFLNKDPLGARILPTNTVNLHVVADTVQAGDVVEMAGIPSTRDLEMTVQDVRGGVALCSWLDGATKCAAEISVWALRVTRRPVVENPQRPIDGSHPPGLTLPSHFQVGEAVSISFDDPASKGDIRHLGVEGHVYAVRFTEGKVWYDVMTYCSDMLLRDIDSVFVHGNDALANLHGAPRRTFG